MQRFGLRVLAGLLLCPCLCSTSLRGQTSAPGDQQPRRVLKVALFEGSGVSESIRRVEEDLQRIDEFMLQRVGVEQITSGKLNGQHVVIFSGGSGGAQGRGLGAAGREEVRRFVAAGGGYVGICAGAYLASADYDWSLNLLDAKVLDRKHWARGFGNVDLSLTPEAAELLQMPAKSTVYYHQGPLLAPAGRTDIPDFVEWARFVTEVRKEGVPGGVMPGTTAIAAGSYGAGRVLAISPHPERTDAMNHVLPAGVRWAAAGPATAAGAKKGVD
ncbi:MAG: BPL-N domain-containing protein [Planctomycetaceae bacterium]